MSEWISSPTILKYFNITAQGGWVTASSSRELESEMEEGLRWERDIRVEFGLTMHGITGIAKG